MQYSGHDNSTEVLTNKGWKKFSQVDSEDKLATVCPVSSELIFDEKRKKNSYFWRLYMIFTLQIQKLLL